MKMQLNLDLGEVAWAVRDRLNQPRPLACLCYKKGHEICSCGQMGALYFQKIPVDGPTAEELTELSRLERKKSS